MSVTEELDKLFKEWENSIKEYNGIFVRDGIINEIEWFKTNPKILFITKEANHYGLPRSGDFRKDWRNGDWKYPFAYRIAEWSFGIINNFPIFNEIYSNPLLYPKTLQKISFLNIKKTGGIGTIDGNIIGKHFDDNRKFLDRQIELINPDTIVLCLSFNEYIRSKMFENAVWKKSGYDINVARWKNLRLIDFYHPSSRNGPGASYSLLQNVFNSKVFKEL